MKILHVGWGFFPFRTGGLIEYTEDLMEIQIKNGYDVSYFCTGRFTILSKKPFLKKWKSKRGYTVYEEWNPPVISGFENGVENPEADISEKATELIFMNVLKQVSPDIVHIQEFLGFPTSLINEMRLMKIKTVYTIQDYYYLCPTIRLVLPDGKFCKIKGEQLGRQCEICCKHAPKNNLNYKLQNIYPAVFNAKTVPVLQKINNLIFNKAAVGEQEQHPCGDENKINNFNARRSYNLDVLSKVDLVIAMSTKVADIFNYFKLVNNMITLNLTLKHIEQLLPKQQFYPEIGKVKFGVINGLSSPIKGRDLLMELFEMIDATPWKYQIEFIIMGRVETEDALTLKKYEFINLAGKYKVAELGNKLDDLSINVGIVPSVWEEAYGFVGIEFLAKGIPVIGNNMGGIADYVTEETGWLNKDNNALGLFNIISELIKDTQKIAAIRLNLVNNRAKYIKTMDTHYEEMDKIYQRLLLTNYISKF